MNASVAQPRGASPFSRGAIFAVIVVGFGAFLAMLYFLSAGDTGPRDRSGVAHVSANGIQGFSALANLLEGEGFDVERSRSPEGLNTGNLLILTPTSATEPEELAQVLENRQYLGPTVVILPKWNVIPPRGEMTEEDEERVQSDWVRLIGATPAAFTEDLPAPFAVTTTIETLGEDEAPNWDGMGLSGVLPTTTILYAEADNAHEPLVVDGAGHVLALNITGYEGSDYYENAHWTIFVVEPDLMNNYGMADPTRAAVALELIREAGYGDMSTVTFDMTMIGFGGSTNLLTLAFQPPFLAATLCLILAIIIVGWRAFLRFGPVAATGQEIAFGKRRLVTNGAGLIVRARRLGLLAGPYVTLIERRLGRALGIAKPDPEAIDQALAIRLPDEESYSSRADRLHNADKPMEILRAAQSLNELTGKLAR